MTEFLNIKVGSLETEASRTEVRAMGEILHRVWSLSTILPGQFGFENIQNIKNLSDLFLKASTDSPPDSTD